MAKDYKWVNLDGLNIQKGLPLCQSYVVFILFLYIYNPVLDIKETYKAIMFNDNKTYLHSVLIITLFYLYRKSFELDNFTKQSEIVVTEDDLNQLKKIVDEKKIYLTQKENTYLRKRKKTNMMIMMMIMMKKMTTTKVITII